MNYILVGCPWKYSDKRHKWKDKLQKNTQFPYCGQRRAFRYEIVFRWIEPCFLHGGSERSACFQPTEAVRFLKKLEVHSVLYGQGKYVFKREFLYLSRYGSFLHFDIVVKEKPQMCIWNWFFAMCSAGKNDMSLFPATNYKRPYEQLLHYWI